MASGPERVGGVGRPAPLTRPTGSDAVALPICVGVALILVGCVACPIRADDGPRGTRPATDLVMADDGVPTGAGLADARAEFRRRHGRVTTRVPTAPAAVARAESLLQEAIGEPSATLRWVLFDEARKLGVAAGSAAVVGRAIRLASAEFEFDELGVELRSLREIPIRALSPGRAGDLARAAEALATRAESDGRDRMTLDALALAVRAWQAAGDDVTARSAAERHDSKVAAATGRQRPSGRGGRKGSGTSPFRGGRSGGG